MHKPNQSGKLSTKIFRKPSNTNISIKAQSCQDPKTALASFKGELCRCHRLCSTEEQVKEEIDFVTKYLDLEKERFGERLGYSIEVEKEIYHYSIPPLIIQPIVENAVNHGISPLISGGDITISIKKKDDFLLVSISDTGVGLDEQSKNKLLDSGVGLSNTDKRLKKMYGKGIELSANNPNGLIVKFSLGNG